MSDQVPPASVPVPDSDAGKPRKVKTGASLWVIGAAGRALVNIPLDFYPRLGQPSASMTSEEIVAEFFAPGGAMAHWGTLDPTAEALDDAIDLAKASLAEVKAQTEYQDGKATRLLTVTTFLTALAGAFFANFASDYPLRTLADQSGPAYGLVLATYLAFLAFVLFALAGALVTFHATRTTFKYPALATVESQAGPTKSFLFFREIIGVTPTGWANSFVTVAPGTTDQPSATLRADLKIEYLKNYVAEGYLIAAKTADKLRYLQPGQSLLAWSLRCLLVYIALLAVTQSRIQPTKAAPVARVEIVQVPQPLAVKIVPPPASPSPPANPGAAK